VRPATSYHHIPRTTLEQWKVLEAIVEEGSFAQAATRLNRSQSSVSYAVARLQEQIGVELLTMNGRRAQLTDSGRALLATAREVLRGAQRLEQLAVHLDQGWEAEVRIAVDLAYPNPALLTALCEFVAFAPDTRLQLREVVLSGAEEALLKGTADLVVGTHIPAGFLGNKLIDVKFIAVAHADHRLHHLGRAPTTTDLEAEIHLVVRDSGSTSPRDDGWLGARQRWTVGSMATSREMVAAGLGFAWLPEHLVADDILRGILKPLNLAQGQERMVALHIVFSDAQGAGPATRHLAQVLAQAVGAYQ